MVLDAAYALTTAIIPKKYIPHAVIAVLVIVAAHTFAQGRRTDRERDMHARVVLLTGGFTPLGLTLLAELARRGAHVIALTPESADAPVVSLVIELVRSTSSNENVYAEQCDLASPESVKRFCAHFVEGRERRLDAIVFAHEYATVGSLFGKKGTEKREKEEKERERGSLGTFLLTTLLLPSLLVAPVERDIRIVNVVNPFYAAAIPSFSSTLGAPQEKGSTFLAEGRRSLRMTVFTRHLQRVLDALPSGSAQVPDTDENVNAVPVVSGKIQRSNIVAISVCPGISRSDTIAPLFRSTAGWIFFMLLRPLLWVLTRSSTAAIQSVLHVLFLPTPFKHRASSRTQSIEVLKPGALYRECAVVRLNVPAPHDHQPRDDEQKGEKVMEDDGEIGGEVAGRFVWESLEAGLKAWDKDK